MEPVPWKQGWVRTAIFVSVYAAVLGCAHLVTPGLWGPKQPIVGRATGSASPLTGQLSSWLASFASLHTMPRAERLRLLKEESEWKNSLVMWVFPASARAQLPHFVQTWIRCWILCAAVYFVVGGLWAYYCYFCFGDKLFKPGTIPVLKDTLEQIKVSNLSMPLYSLLPAFTEFCAEMGWTLAYPRIDNVGLPMYAVYFFLYMTSVEFCVYWMHRGLHEIRWAYKLLHRPHHKYNKEHTLSPFAGLAFHPFDGMLQALPYTTTLFFCPMHFLTHELLLFATGVWTTNIHDCVHGKVKPIMGAGYHTIHHTTYKHNYGHYFTFIDQMYNTCIDPEEYDQETMEAENSDNDEPEQEQQEETTSKGQQQVLQQRQGSAGDIRQHAAVAAAATEAAMVRALSEPTATAMITAVRPSTGVTTRSRAKAL